MKFDYRTLSYLFPYSDFTFPVNWSKLFGENNPITVEIGFGLGEVLVENVKNNKNVNYIGIEQNWERVYRCLKSVVNVNEKIGVVDNLKILKTDARQAFKWMFTEKSISNIYSFFPCPWPKKSHIKHRLFSTEFLKTLNNRLVDGGVLRIVTDYYLYQQWVEEEVSSTGFRIEKSTIAPQFNTKFEKKWIEEGQKEFFEINLIKEKHQENVGYIGKEMKAYKFNKCDLSNIVIDDLKGATTVICKEIVVDQDQNKALIRLVVSEESLTQYFWVIVVKDKDMWRLKKIDGQTFFPTPGIALALEHVYKQIKK